MERTSEWKNPIGKRNYIIHPHQITKSIKILKFF